VLTTAATDDEGVEAVWEAIESHRTHLEATGALGAKRRARLLREVEALAAERFRLRVTSVLEADDELANDLVERRVDPYEAAAMLVTRAAG
jgi:LAO/AO transport system kinase